MNAFGKLRFQNELHTLRKKIGGKWHGKLNEIEETVLNLKEDTPIDSTSNDIKVFILNSFALKICNNCMIFVCTIHYRFYGKY